MKLTLNELKILIKECYEEILNEAEYQGKEVELN